MCEVSVIIPMFNSEKYIKEAVDSIISQTYSDFEILIIDNCSNDNSVEIVKNIDDSRIKVYVNEKNLGLSYSRNLGIEKANGKYIALLDSDDIAMPNRIAREVEYLDNNKNVVAVGGFSTIMNQDGIDYDLFRPQLTNPNYIRAYMMLNNAVANGTAMFRSDIVKSNNIRYEDRLYGVEDYKFWCDLLEYGDIANIGEIFMRYRVFLKSETNMNVSLHEADRKRVFKEIQLKNLENYGFELDEEERDILLGSFSETGEIEDVQEIESLFNILKKITKQAYANGLKNSKEIETMCRKRFGEKISKSFFLWN